MVVELHTACCSLPLVKGIHNALTRWSTGFRHWCSIDCGCVLCLERMLGDGQEREFVWGPTSRCMVRTSLSVFHAPISSPKLIKEMTDKCMQVTMDGLWLLLTE